MSGNRWEKVIDCPMHGPSRRRISDPIGACPVCEMTPGEHAYRDRILADSDAVFRQECRAFQYQRDAERAPA